MLGALEDELLLLGLGLPLRLEERSGDGCCGKSSAKVKETGDVFILEEFIVEDGCISCVLFS